MNTTKMRYFGKDKGFGQRFAEGGSVSWNPLSNLLGKATGALQGRQKPTPPAPQQKTPPPVEYGPTQEQGGPQRSSDASDSDGDGAA
jgi:hypothetical protein